MIRALLVDDEAPARERLRRLVESLEVEVVGEAAGGDEAIASAAALQPDVIFLDIQMPGLSGLEVAARLPAPRPRVVFCTAYDEFAVPAFERQAVDYLLKPVGRDRLARTIDRIAGEVTQLRARRREEHAAARTQQHLLPGAAARVAGIDCAGECRPAHVVSGDFYDFLPVDQHRMALVIGDVSGKGQFAGLLAAAIQARLQALVAAAIVEPAQVLEQLDALTRGRIDDDRFATVFYGLVDSAAATLRYASAGHLPALIVSAGGVRTLDPTGPAIGWSLHLPHVAVDLTLRRGDVVVAYTDGISEACDPAGRELGAAGLAELARDHRAQTPAQIVHGLFTDVARFTGEVPPDDDRTIVVARMDGES